MHSSNNFILTRWNDGEPNDGNWYSSSEDCIEMNESKGFQWNDEGCGSKRRYGTR